MYKMIGSLLAWYVDRVITSWQREFRRLGSKDNKWLWVCLCLFFSIFLLPYLITEAFSDSLLLGLSFVWSAFWAISFGYVLRNPLLMILVYVGVVFGREITKVFTAAEEEAAVGNIIGAAIMIFLGICLMVWANSIKRGEV